MTPTTEYDWMIGRTVVKVGCLDEVDNGLTLTLDDGSVVDMYFNDQEGDIIVRRQPDES